jgi:phosphatidylinositol-3-phosphatase
MPSSLHIAHRVLRRCGRLAAVLCLLAAGTLAWSCELAVADVGAATSVTVSEPALDATVNGQITLGAQATDDVAVVKWYVDGVPVATDTDGFPWTRAWDSARITNGVHKVFTVDNPPALIDAIGPTLAVTAPKSGETQRGAVTLSAVAFDNVGVTRVKWYVDGSEAAFDGDGAPWTHSWDSRQLVNGAHRVFAKARDAAGNWSSSASVTFSTDNAPCGTASASPATWDHVVWIVFENKSYSHIIDAPEAPYLTDLAAKCGLATDYHGVAHPSLPNYIAMTSGGTQDITDDTGPAAHPLAVASIFSQLGAGGWRALQESMPSNCYKGNSGLYAARHNPPLYYVGVADDCLLQDVPLGPAPDLSARFTFITPNLCHDMHSSPCADTAGAEVAAGDAWLTDFLPTVLSTKEYRAGSTAVFITWDEDDFTDVQHVPTLVIAPSVTPGRTDATTFDHYSLLRTTEEMLGLDPLLDNAATAPSMRGPFGL